MKTAGRKRSFDKDKALDTAIKVFWNNGYAGTSLADLTSALGIASLGHYARQYSTPTMTELTGSDKLSFRQRLENYLHAQAGLIGGELSAKGCFIVNSCCEADGGEMTADINRTVNQWGLQTKNQWGHIWSAPYCK